MIQFITFIEIKSKVTNRSKVVNCNDYNMQEYVKLIKAYSFNKYFKTKFGRIIPKDFEYRDLKYSNFKNKNLKFANLSHGDFRFSNFRGADMRCANLEEADLSFSDLRGTDLTGANLKDCNLHKVILDKEGIIR